MPYIRKRAKRWRAEVDIVINYERFRDSRTFDTKAEAFAWGSERKKELERGYVQKTDHNKTFKDALQRYLDEETPKKRSARTEALRIKYFLRSPALNVSLKLHTLTPDYFEKYIEYRLKQVMTSTINKEISIMRSVIRLAKKWKWIDHNPFEGITRLKEPPPRDRRISDFEISRILESLTYKEGIPPTQARHRVAIMFLFALETAMRIGEICDLDWGNINLNQQFLKVVISKNGDSRDVPLSSRAVSLLEMMKAHSRELTHEKEVTDEFGRTNTYRAMPVFYENYRASAGKASALFKKYVLRANIYNLTFHDTRHEACTRLARKVDALDLAKIIGHRDPRSLMIYYNPTASEIAKRLG